MEIAIYFARHTEYTWTGDLSDLPPAVRKGVTKREDGETVLDEELLSERLEDAVLEKLTKTAEVGSDEYEISEVGEA